MSRRVRERQRGPGAAHCFRRRVEEGIEGEELHGSKTGLLRIVPTSHRCPPGSKTMEDLQSILTREMRVTLLDRIGI